jgi:hypothetical protein
MLYCRVNTSRQDIKEQKISIDRKSTKRIWEESEY